MHRGMNTILYLSSSFVIVVRTLEAFCNLLFCHALLVAYLNILCLLVISLFIFKYK